MVANNNEPLYSIKDVKKLIPLSTSWWRQQIFRKKIKYLKVGGRIFIPQSTISELLRTAVVEPRPGKGSK